jgi:hypothetical protein
MASTIFLVSLLPELTWEGDPPFTSHAFLEEGPEVLGSIRDDIDKIILFNDVKNLRRLWMRKHAPGTGAKAPADHDFDADLFSPRILNTADLDLLLSSRPGGAEDLPAEIPPLLRSFVTEREGAATEADLERLFHDYFRWLKEQPSRFLKDWAEFELNLRMFVAAVRSRKRGTDVEKVFPQDEEFMEVLVAGKAQSDFGASGFFPESEAVLAALALPLPDRARALDQVRFEWLRWTDAERMFDADSVLSFFVRLLLLERWARIRELPGARIIEDTILKKEADPT